MYIPLKVTQLFIICFCLYLGEGLIPPSDIDCWDEREDILSKGFGEWVEKSTRLAVKTANPVHLINIYFLNIIRKNGENIGWLILPGRFMVYFTSFLISG